MEYSDASRKKSWTHDCGKQTEWKLTTLDPSTTLQTSPKRRLRFQIVEIHEANCCALIQIKHRVDCFCQLSTARFVDAASVDPNVLQPLLERQSTCFGYLSISLFSYYIGQHHVLEGHLFLAPRMRENSVRLADCIHRFQCIPEPLASRIEQPHGY